MRSISSRSVAPSSAAHWLPVWRHRTSSATRTSRRSSPTTTSCFGDPPTSASKAVYSLPPATSRASDELHILPEVFDPALDVVDFGGEQARGRVAGHGNAAEG